MNVVKPLSSDDPYGLLPDEPEIEVEFEEDNSEVIENPDGSATVIMDKEAPEEDLSKLGHFENLADSLSEEKLSSISREVVDLVKADLSGRKEWEEAYVNGLEFLGIKVEERTVPWNGASGVFHPILMEAAVRFQSQAIQEVFPPAGPAKTRIIGKETPEIRAKAVRIQDELNFQLTAKMPYYRGETERLLFVLAISGSAFRKGYYDTQKKRACARLIQPEDFIVPYGESDLDSAERFTHVCHLSKNEIKKQVLSGYYRDVDLTDPGSHTESEVKEKSADLMGVLPTPPHTDKYQVWETHIDLDIGEDPNGMPLPYVVCIERDSEKILSVRRNWDETDPERKRKSWFVAYEYVPGIGFYGLGLIHLIGGIAQSSTSIMRQLIDAGTLNNLPGGLKARGLRIKGDDTPIRPGEFRDVDVAAGKISDSITFLPTKEPSAVLHGMLRELVEEGRRVGSIAEVDVGDIQGEAPVGTVLALLERAQKVMSAVQARLHNSMGKELNLIASIIRDYMPDEYEYSQGETAFSRREDFNSSGVEILPVSDPGATTMSQRVVQHQAAMLMSSQAPQVYDIAKLHRTGLEILGFKNAEEIVPLPEEMKPVDPVSENAAIISGKPVKVFMEQDHEAHIAVHMAAMQDPKLMQIIGQSPAAPMVMQAAQAHIAEHVALAYRQKMERLMGMQLPAPGQPIDPQMEAQIARGAVQAAEQLLQKHAQEAQAEAAAQAAQDPVLQLQARDLEVKEKGLEYKREADMAKIASSEAQSLLNAQVELARIAQNAEVEGARIGAKAASDHEKIMADAQKAADQLEARAKESKARERASGKSKTSR